MNTNNEQIGTIDIGNKHISSYESNDISSAELKSSKKSKLQNGDHVKKPTESYYSMITEAIISSPKRRLTVSEIYAYLENKYEYFRVTSSGWKV